MKGIYFLMGQEMFPLTVMFSVHTGTEVHSLGTLEFFPGCKAVGV
jgi:hypothetical protein